MMIAVLLAVTLLFSQTPATPQPTVVNVFTDLGNAHCATDIAFAAYAQTDPDDDFAALAQPAYVTYSAFQFDSADAAVAALDDAPGRVADAFSDEANFSDREDFDDLVTEAVSEDYGDASSAYVMALPVDNEALDNELLVEMLGIVKHDQLLVILMFSNAGTTGPGPGIVLEAIPPFAADLDDTWDGTGSLDEAIPAEDAMPEGWERRDLAIEDPPAC